MYVFKPRSHRVSSLRIVMIAFIIALIFKTFALDLVIVRGESMTPTITPGTIALVWRCAYGIRLPFIRSYVVRWNPPIPGDIVVAEPSTDTLRRAVKRVFEVGPAYMHSEAGVLTGRGGTIPLPDSALAQLSGTTFILPDRLFLVGDNALVSFDSREYGPVPIEKIVGKVLLYSRGASGPDQMAEPSKETVDDVY